MLGFDSDNDSAFMNETLFDYCKAHNLEQTRSRAYKSNDQAWVEQKNGSVVRHFAGYDRFEGLEATTALSRLYQHIRLYVNFFQPSFKLKEKRREGARVKKFYYPPATPCDRLLGDERVSEQAKEKLRERREQLDPVELLHQIREAQADLKNMPNSARSKSLQEFLATLPKLWREGEASPVHQETPRKTRTWRTRKDPFDSTWPKILGWLEEQPELAAKEILLRLQLETPDLFTSAQLRTLQRRVKDWRHSRARELVHVSFAAGNLASTNKPAEAEGG